MSEHFSKNNIRAFDRDYDNNRYYEYLIKHNEKFVIRARKNRNVNIGFISEKADERIAVMQLVEQSKRIYEVNKFVFYAITHGLFVIFSKCQQGIADMLKKKPISMQLSLFSDTGFGWC